MNGQQAFVPVIENQMIGQGHFRAHRVAAEDHPSIERGQLAHGAVKLATFDGQVLPALRIRQFEPGSNLLPETIR
ncbi:hypothetical protein [Bradyrhizobium sp. WU425]|uniref:hypothetical protein n=1 Tax=Bradyrhizobium sp. WU425 TaxID=187029 RepID=UPI001E5EA063|nr:hypothetical protein [Bradyrhizobium canariense]UFW74282.1 hypothetical protein BcanWU425_11190 [Bradyrhizobium canariense]